MPGIVPRRRSRMYDDEDEENISDIEHSTQNANKRARLSVNGNAPRHDADMQDTPAARLQEHQPGAIVKVTLKDFVTYTAATFYPGPALNMIIGPNGTGKSTLVCAICLGLAASPNLLGRAKEVGEFVKHGASDAYVEIELKGKRGQRNYIVRTHIKRDGNKRTFQINGQAATQKAVTEMARTFSIQLDNLCQFLPQDRVVEFSALSPENLLASTVRAAAPPQMTEWHDRLKELRIEQRKAISEQAEAKKTLSDLQKKQDQQRVDVERLRERTELIKTINILEKLRPIADTAVLKAKHLEARETKIAVKAERDALKRELDPALAAVDAKNAYLTTVERARKSAETVYERTLTKSEGHVKKMADLKKEITNCEQRRNAEMTSEKTTKQEFAKHQNTIRGLQNLMKEEPVAFDLPAMQAQIRDCDRQIIEIDDETGALREAMQQRLGEMKDREKRVENAEERLMNLKTQAGQSETLLRSRAPDAGKLFDFIKSNRDRFGTDVYGPPLVECNVSDKAYADAVESLLRDSDILSAFTVQTQEDYKLLNAIVYDELKLTDISIRVSNKSLDHWQDIRRSKVMTDEQTREFDIDGWALDYMTGPEPVLGMLCSDAQLHSTPVMKRDCDDNKYNRLARTELSKWIAGNSIYTIMRRKEYNAQSAGVKTLSAAKWWTTHAVDTSIEADLRDNIGGWQGEVQELKRQLQADKAKQTDLVHRRQDIAAEKKRVTNEKGEKQKAKAAFDNLPVQLDTAKAKLQTTREKSEKYRETLDQIRDEEVQLTISKGQEAINYARAIDILRQLHTQLITVTLQYIEAKSDHEEVEARNVDMATRLQEKEDELEAASRAVRDIAGRYTRAVNSLATAMEHDEALREYFTAMTDEEKQRTPEELQGEIYSKQARLALLHEGDPTLIRTFEDRARTISRLAERVTNNESGLEQLEASVVEIREQWEPQLDELVSKISDAFAESFLRIDSAGEVIIHKAGEEGRDFENWAIHIRCRFREGEEMQTLDSHRQSGGERAVCTIFYLMSLQTLSRAPFRVVDEINQGMDPRNERIVHERMVDIACGTGILRPEADGEGLATGLNENGAGGQLSQYFLITPKLLSGLKYVPGMTVHCIASGEYMPETEGAVSFPGYLKKKLALLKSRGSLIGAAA